MRTDRARLAPSREVFRTRAGHPAPADVAYGVYVGLLLVLIRGVPVIRFAVLALLALLETNVQPSLTDDAARHGIAAVAALLLASAAVAGRIRGPVVPRPFFGQVLGGSDLPRRATLRRPFLVSTFILAGSLLLIAGVVLISLLISDAAELSGAGAYLAGTFAFVVLLGVV